MFYSGLSRTCERCRPMLRVRRVVFPRAQNLPPELARLFPVWIVLWPITQLDQRASHQNAQPDTVLHVHRPLSSSKPARERLCPLASVNLRVCPRPRLVRKTARGVLSPAGKPRVLVLGPALPLACCDFGSLSLGFHIWAVRALEEKISVGLPIQ